MEEQFFTVVTSMSKRLSNIEKQLEDNSQVVISTLNTSKYLKEVFNSWSNDTSEKLGVIKTQVGTFADKIEKYKLNLISDKDNNSNIDRFKDKVSNMKTLSQDDICSQGVESSIIQKTDDVRQDVIPQISPHGAMNVQSSNVGEITSFSNQNIMNQMFTNTNEPQLRSMSNFYTPKKKIFISRTHPDTSVNEIQDFVQYHFNCTGIVSKLKTKFNTYSSFILLILNRFNKISSSIRQ